MSSFVMISYEFSWISYGFSFIWHHLDSYTLTFPTSFKRFDHKCLFSIEWIALNIWILKVSLVVSIVTEQFKWTKNVSTIKVKESRKAEKQQRKVEEKRLKERKIREIRIVVHFFLSPMNWTRLEKHFIVQWIQHSIFHCFSSGEKNMEIS